MMKEKSVSRMWLMLTALVVVAVFIVLISPNERTLGAGIKAVYVHVSFTWAGMLGFLVAGVLGLLMLFKQNPKLQSWNKIVSWVALGWFAFGAALSVVAAKINWGNVFWSEPRMLATLQFLIMATLILITKKWLPWGRVQGLLSIAVFLLLIWSLADVQLILHPKNPIGVSATSIQLTFFGLFLLSTLMAGCLIWYFAKKQRIEQG